MVNDWVSGMIVVSLCNLGGRICKKWNGCWLGIWSSFWHGHSISWPAASGWCFERYSRGTHVSYYSLNSSTLSDTFFMVSSFT